MQPELRNSATSGLLELDWGNDGDERFGEPADLYPKQEDLVGQVLEAVADGYRRIALASPTGSGKTEMMVALMSELPYCVPEVEGWQFKQTPIVWMTHKKELNSQSGKRMRRRGIRCWNLTPRTFPTRGIQIEGNGSYLRKECHPARIVPAPGVIIGSAQMLDRCFDIENHFNKTSILLIDEGHHCDAATWKRVVQKWPGIIVAASATWWRLSDRQGFPDFEILIQKYGVMDYINDGTLAPLNPVGLPGNMIFAKGTGLRNGEYTNVTFGGDANGSMFLRQIADYCMKVRPEQEGKFGQARQTIAFFMTQQQAQEWAKEMELRLNSEGEYGRVGLVMDLRPAVDSDDDKDDEEEQTFVRTGKWSTSIAGMGDWPETIEMDREAVVEKFEKGEIWYIANVNILTEGFDCNGATQIILARPTKSLVVYLQQVGRGTRPNPAFPYNDIVDFSGCMKEHGSPMQPRIYQLEPRNDAPPRRPGPSKTCPGTVVQRCGVRVPAATTKCPFCGYEFGKTCHGNCGKFQAWKSWTINMLGDKCDFCLNKAKPFVVDTYADALEGSPDKLLELTFREGTYQFTIEWNEIIPDFGGMRRQGLFSREEFHRQNYYADPRYAPPKPQWHPRGDDWMMDEVLRYPVLIGNRIADTTVRELVLEGAIDRLLQFVSTDDPLDIRYGLLTEQQYQAVIDDKVHLLPGCVAWDEENGDKWTVEGAVAEKRLALAAAQDYESIRHNRHVLVKLLADVVESRRDEMDEEFIADMEAAMEEELAVEMSENEYKPPISRDDFEDRWKNGNREGSMSCYVKELNVLVWARNRRWGAFPIDKDNLTTVAACDVIKKTSTKQTHSNWFALTDDAYETLIEMDRDGLLR